MLVDITSNTFYECTATFATRYRSVCHPDVFFVFDGFNEGGKIRFYLCGYLPQVTVGPNA
jgi:hypothetical protein